MSTLALVYYLVAVVFIVVDVFVVIGFFYVLDKAWHFHPTYEAHGGEGHGPAHRETMHDIVMKERWHAIVTKMRSGTPEGARVAIIEADALVDTALKGMRVEGEHLADRLSNLEGEEIKAMPRVWRAHRVRNDLVHTPGFAIAERDAERTMLDYEAFLREIKVID